MSKKKYDIAILGAGPGGYIAAVHAGKLGYKTVCIDRREAPGGTCLHVGCIPSKTLLYSTELYSHLQKKGASYGIHCKDLSINFAELMTYKSQVVAGLVQGVSGLFKAHYVDYIQGSAQFISPHHIQVGQEEIEADFIIIASGSESITLPILPIDEKRIVTSTGALALQEIPKRLAVVGGGVIGVELASVYKRLGSEVTVVEMLDKICPGMDLSVSKSLLQILLKQGLSFQLATQVIEAKVEKKEVVLQLKREGQDYSLAADVVLVAIGRKPFSQGLALDKVGVAIDKRGFVSVDNCFRTQHAHIFAIGDVIEGPMLAHRASEEGVAVVEFIAGRRHPVNYMAIPNVIYTSPEAASVGLTEQEAKQLGLNVKTGTAYFKANARAHCSGETEGFVKVIGDEKSRRLLGVHMVGSHVSELIGEGMIAIMKEATIDDLARAPNAHPTLSETLKEAATALG